MPRGAFLTAPKTFLSTVGDGLKNAIDGAACPANVSHGCFSYAT